jgi:hypothetical protein
MSVDAEQRLSLRQADHARGDLYVLQDKGDFLKARIARILARADLATDNLARLAPPLSWGKCGARIEAGVCGRPRTPALIAIKRPCVPAVAMP